MTDPCITPVRADQTSDRGLNGYTDFIDLNHQRIVVSRSSLAEHDAVRVYNYGDGSGQSGRMSCIHVCRQGARELRDALDRFLADDQWAPCDTPAWQGD